MSRADTWMPLYIGDYLGDTMALEAREHGAYLLLIMHYWRNGPLPDDDRALAGIARVDRAMWLADTGPIVRAFFTARDGKLFHKRIEQEREAADAVSDTKRAAARARWDKEKKPSPGAAGGSGPAPANEAGRPEDSAPAYANGHAYASDVHVSCISPSPSPSEEERKKEPPSVVARARGRPRPTTVPAEDWKPSDALIAFGTERGMSIAGIAEAADKMRDWVRANGKRPKDWDATFRNWLRGDLERQRAQRKRWDQNPIGTLQRDWNLPSVALRQRHGEDDDGFGSIVLGVGSRVLQ